MITQLVKITPTQLVKIKTTKTTQTTQLVKTTIYYYFYLPFYNYNHH